MLLFFSYYTKRAKKFSQLQSNRNDQPNPVYEEVDSDYGYSICKPLHGQGEKHNNLPSRVIGENCHKFVKDEDFQQETNVAYGISQTLITSSLVDGNSGESNPGEGNDEIKSQDVHIQKEEVKDITSKSCEIDVSSLNSEGY